MRPTTLALRLSESKDLAYITVHSPKRIMYPRSPTHELCGYKFVLELKDGSHVDLDSTATNFSESSFKHCIQLPPQIHRTAGFVKVGAVYGEGEEEKTVFRCQGGNATLWYVVC